MTNIKENEWLSENNIYFKLSILLMLTMFFPAIVLYISYNYADRGAAFYLFWINNILIIFLLILALNYYYKMKYKSQKYFQLAGNSYYLDQLTNMLKNCFSKKNLNFKKLSKKRGLYKLYLARYYLIEHHLEIGIFDSLGSLYLYIEPISKDNYFLYKKWKKDLNKIIKKYETFEHII
jgi:hypothetical protein